MPPGRGSRPSKKKRAAWASPSSPIGRQRACGRKTAPITLPVALCAHIMENGLHPARLTNFERFIDHRSRLRLCDQGATPARLGYYDNYLVNNDSCVIVGLQGTAAHESGDSGRAGHARFTQWQGREPESLAANTTYGDGEFLPRQ